MICTSEPNFWALVLALITTLGLTPIFIRAVRRKGWGQKIREEGPADHQVKAGTPTMGGAVFVLAACVSSLAFASPNLELLVLWVAILGGFAIGLLDDLTSILKGRNLGLKARQKLVLQGILGLFPAAYLVWGRGVDELPMPIGMTLSGSLVVLGVGVLVVISTTNAVNLSDGMDGLASGAAIPVLLFFAGLGFFQQQAAVTVTALSLVGGLLGFLWFNGYPARIFMGDTGSLALGAALAGMALVLGRPLMLLVVGGLFVAEAGSVILQVATFKLTGGKRLFRMSPIHHHFALSGMPEVQVVIRFWLISTFCSLAGLYAVYEGAAW